MFSDSAKIKTNKASKRQARIQMKSGFSLIEVLIALLILSVGIVGVSALMAGNTRTTINAKNQVIATGLAQEGAELVANLKYNNPTTFKSDNVDASTNIPDNDNYRIGINMLYPNFKGSPSDGVTRHLSLEGSGAMAGFYYYQPVTSITTKFSRKAIIRNNPNKTISVIVLVTWDGSGTFPAIAGWDPTLTTPSIPGCNVSSKCISIQSVLPDAS